MCVGIEEGVTRIRAERSHHEGEAEWTGQREGKVHADIGQ